jgi:hypothetical protein
MNRYIIKSRHTAEDCKLAVKHFKEHHASFLTHFLWGCYDDDHTAYAFVDAESHEEAALIVPPLFREKAEVVHVVSFNPKTKGDTLHSEGN